MPKIGRDVGNQVALDKPQSDSMGHWWNVYIFNELC
jgi:hypothetical protein